MLPVILASNSEKKTNQFLEEYIKKNHIMSAAIHRFVPEKKEFSIETVRELKQELKLQYHNPHLFILYNFDTASLEAQNAMLKTLEEKNNSYRFILVVAKAHTLIPTILSRCKVVSLNKDNEKNSKYDELFNALIQQSASPYHFFEDKTIQGLDHDEALLLLNAGILFFRTLLNTDRKSALILNKLLAIHSLVELNNINPQLAVDNLLIFIDKTYRMNS